MKEVIPSAHRARGWLVVLLVFVAGAFFAIQAGYGSGARAQGAEKVLLKTDSDPAPMTLANFRNGFSSVIDPALPKVVNISSTKIVKRQNNIPGLFNDPFFRQFFGDQFPAQPAQPQSEREYSLGSGVIVNPDGYVLTNNHVVSGASDIEVFTQDRKKYKARVIGTDAQTDIAVLKIDATGLSAFTLADSSNLKVGDIVFAIGDPFGVGETATMGIVSATGRALGSAIEHYENFIQTDAAINPGNSGGALIDVRGDLAGINTAIITGGGGGSQGVGFAIPVNMARNVMDQIIQHGHVVRGHMGVLVQSVTPDMAKAFGLSHGGGALVGDVTPGGPAAKAGIERGDIILEMDGKSVNGPDDLSVRISETAPGTTVRLKVFRNGQSRDVDVTLSESTETSESAAPTSGPASLDGVNVQTLTPGLASQFGPPRDTRGVIVASVDPSSPAAAAGLQHGDVIEEVNHKPVRNVAQYRQALAGTSGSPVLLLVNHGGATEYMVLQAH